MFILSTPEISDDRCPKRQKARCAKASDVIGEVTRVTGPTAAPPGGLPAGSDRKPGGGGGGGSLWRRGDVEVYGSSTAGQPGV